MSAYTLTKGSVSALAMLATQTGSDTLLLTEPARELRATIRIEPAGTLMGGPLRAELFLGEQRHSITVQRGDTANAQHLAEWVESIANGTLDTAEAIPQRAAPAELLPCHKCGGEAIGYDYAIPGHEFRHGVKCRYRDCQTVESFKSSQDAHVFWNAIQRADSIADASDMIDHPPRYTGHPSGVECIEVAEHLPFCLGNAFEYLFRRANKGEARENLQKALWYVRQQQQLTPDGLPHGHLCSRASKALAGILAFEPPPYRDAMELVATGRLLGCAEHLIQKALAGLPN